MPGPIHVYDTGSVLLNITPIATILLVQVIELVTAFTVACGTLVDELTATVDVLVHPDVGWITTNVQVPGAPTVVVNEFGDATPPNQVAVDPAGVPDPVKVTVLTPHAKVCVAPALAVGVVRLFVTVATAVLVHPLAVLVVVKVQLPVVVAVAFAKLIAPDKPAPVQLYATPDKGPPCNIAEELIHVIAVAKLAVAAGAVVLVPTIVAAVLVHPFAPVTANV